MPVDLQVRADANLFYERDLTHVMSVSLELNPKLELSSAFTTECQFYFFWDHLSYLFTFNYHHRIVDFLEIVLSPVPDIVLSNTYLLNEPIECSEIYCHQISLRSHSEIKMFFWRIFERLFFPSAFLFVIYFNQKSMPVLNYTQNCIGRPSGYREGYYKKAALWNS